MDCIYLELLSPLNNSNASGWKPSFTILCANTHTLGIPYKLSAQLLSEIYMSQQEQFRVQYVGGFFRLQHLSAGAIPNCFFQSIPWSFPVHNQMKNKSDFFGSSSHPWFCLVSSVGVWWCRMAYPLLVNTILNQTQFRQLWILPVCSVALMVWWKVSGFWKLLD